MLDLRLIREQPQRVKSALVALNTDAPIDEILALDTRRRALLTEVEALKAERNEGSKLVNRTKDAAARQPLIDNLRGLGDQIAHLDQQAKAADTRLAELLLTVPNLPAPEVPVGPDESHNVVVAEEGTKPSFAFAPKPHWELAEALGIIEFERATKVSGARFYALVGDGARLQRALIAWMLDLHRERHGYTEIAPPYLVTEQSLFGTGQLPKFRDTQFQTTAGDHWLIPTAEVPLTNLYRDEILDAAQLPIYHTAYTACFRREQFSGGRDVRGIKRSYQFDKVEMVKFVHPDESATEFRRLIEEASDILRLLGLPFRLLQICTGDLSFTAANKVDLEVWAAGAEEWLEVSSCATFLDFQARRANIRFRPADVGRPQFVHTLNGSGLALPRTVIALLEHYQLEDGTIAVPEVLRAYLGGQETIGVQPPLGPPRPPSA
ncbi:MAG: Seryl-tRNA synthetase [uncultured Thermomicrobiales bacterium]|uniref:Serine--tRNA ligase n=1 Tax=uncultured Thermomicrobiales bacterium TaxID=1645740 RepID=A0A6J4TNR6_9BACT|nr:MAG: Seryl-tRNA synthetase [uncultured Thermomicrobiales bacterium]